MHKLIQVPLSKEIQIAYGGRKVKRKIVIMGWKLKVLTKEKHYNSRFVWEDLGKKGR